MDFCKKRARIDKIIPIINQLAPAESVLEVFERRKNWLDEEYKIVTSVILSQNCTEKISDRQTQLLTGCRNLSEILSLSETEMKKIIRPCGHTESKYKYLLALFKILSESRLPLDIEKLTLFPGIGFKSASLIRCYKSLPGFVVDTHVLRCLRRWKITESKDPEKIAKEIMEKLNSEEWTLRSLQIIAIGKKYCKAKKHDISICPICRIVSNDISFN